MSTADQLRASLDSELDFTFHQRELNTEDHAAWQVLHGALAFQRAFPVVHQGRRVSAVDHVLQGGSLRGWTCEPGIWRDEQKSRRGLRMLLEEGSKSGQGHPDQWLAVLAQCGLTADQEMLVDGATYQMQDLVAQVQWDVPRNLQREYSWTLIGLTSYLPCSATWTASDGQLWSIERLLAIELEQELASSACGGTHRLIGMTMALNRHLSQGGKAEGVWGEADERIQAAIEDARRYQNADGSFSTHYFERPGTSFDLAQNLGTSGHVVEFLALAMTEEQLREAWVQRAVQQMCELFHKTRGVPLECGALYHAAHGLVLYRDRLYGPRPFEFNADPAPASNPDPDPT